MSKRLTPHLAGVLALFIATLPCSAIAQSTMQLYPLKTVTVTSEQFLTGSKESKPGVIAGELRIPSGAANRVPAVVIVHGAVGVGDHEDNWTRRHESLTR